MFRECDDGITMDNTLLLIDEEESGFSVRIRLLQFLVIAVGGWSGILMLVQTIGIPCNIVWINGAVLVFTVLLYLLCLPFPYDLVKLFFCILGYGLFFYSRLSRILNGFYIAENVILQHAAAYYGTTPLEFEANYSSGQADTTLFVLMILFPVIGFLSLAVVRNVMVAFTGVIMLLPVSACFVLGLVPSEGCTIAYAVCLLYLTRSGYKDYHVTELRQSALLHRISSRSAGWICLISLCAFFLIKLFISREDYDRLTQIEEVKAEIQAAMDDFSIEEFREGLSQLKLLSKKVSSTGLNGGELGKTGQVQYQNTKQLVITAPIGSIEEGIYLKGYVGSVYTGDRWEKHSPQMQEEYKRLSQKLPLERFSPVNQMSEFLGHLGAEEGEQAISSGEEVRRYEYSTVKGTMKVEYTGANKKYLYAPYFTDYDALDNLIYEQDLYAVPIRKEDSYELRYNFNVYRINAPEFYQVLSEKLGDYANYEQLYRDYVRRIYTQLPQDGLLNMKRDFASERLANQTESITEKIEYVKNYLHENTQYSLTPGKLPEGEDFVEYFLYQSKVGYCAHYASAATLMLRTMGVAARYVEGYAVGSEGIYQSEGFQEATRYTNTSASSAKVAQYEVNVMDYNAHAWVEVYFDNCGWVPVEFTPGSSVDYNDTVVADVEDFSNHIENGSTRNNLEEAPPVSEPEQRTPTSQPTPSQSNGSAGQKEESQGPDKSKQIFIWTVPGGLLLALFFLLKHRINQTKKGRYIRNINKRALFCYAEIQKMLRVGGGLPEKSALLEESEEYVRSHFEYINEHELERIMEIARRARFGKGWIKEEEFKQLLIFRDELYQGLMSGLPPLMRIYLKGRLLI